MESLTFQIDGKWFSNHLRTLFWDDSESFEDVEIIGLKSLGLSKDSVEPVDLISGILEYRYELVGVNDFELVDLPKEQYKPLSDKITQLEIEQLLANIQAEMNSNPLKYVDPYSTVMSCNPTFGILDRGYDFIIDYFSCGRTPWTNRYLTPFQQYETSTKCGLWLLDNPRFIFKIGGYKGIDSPTFWEDLARYIEEHYPYDEAFKERNARWYAHLRRQSNYDYGDEREVEDDFVEKVELWEIIEPDDYKSCYGLVDREGRWYSSDFGGHEMKALHLCEDEAELVPNIDYALMHKHLSDWNKWDVSKDCLTYLLDVERWAMLHEPIPGNGYIIQTGKDVTRLTPKQRNALWDVIVEFELDTTHIRNLDLIM